MGDSNQQFRGSGFRVALPLSPSPALPHCFAEHHARKLPVVWAPDGASWPFLMALDKRENIAAQRRASESEARVRPKP